MEIANNVGDTALALAPTFGVPATVCTNVSRAAGIDLVTRVRLAAGAVTLTAGGGAFKAWLDRSRQGRPPLLLVDGESRPTVTMSLAKWRTLAGLTGDEDEARTRVYLTSATNGTRTLTFSFSAGGALTDSVTQRITFVDPPLLPDYNRDGVIDEFDVAAYLSGCIFRFWTNEDVWDGDDAFDYWLTTYAFGNPNGSDGHVNGRCDMVNLFPLAVDVRAFVSVWGSGATFCLRPRFPSSVPTLRYREVNLSWESVSDIHEADVPIAGGGMLHGAALTSLTMSDVSLSASLVAASTTSSATLAVEASRSLENPIDLVIMVNGEEVYSFTPPMRFSSIEKMYRWMNLRTAAGGTVGGAEFVSRLGDPENSPDSEHGGNAHVVFVHGYNVSEKEAKYWGEGVYKRLWWSGLDARFTTVAWYGNDGQYWLLGNGFITPDYQVNVEHAFATAATLANELNQQGGKKFIIAHSLGNMLVSAAIQDYGMEYEKYFMLNAAVAMEAFDPTGGATQESHDKMTPEAWTNYTDRVRSTHWFERFPEGDGRRLLTWKGRFANVTNIVNFYSTQEEVVNNGDGDWHPVTERNYVWYNQETRKGEWPLMLHEYEGGWVFNSFYDTVTNYWVGGLPFPETCHMPPAAADLLPDAQLQQIPFFLDFHNPEMHTSSNGAIVASNYLYRAEMLAYAIPAESFSVGANPLPGGFSMPTNGSTHVLYDNYDMATIFTSGRDDLPENHATDTKKMHRDWQHSTFVQRSFKRVHQLFKAIFQHIKETHNE